MALLLRSGSSSLTFRGALSARKGVLRVSHIILYNNISTTCRTCFVRRGQSGRGPFYRAGSRGRLLSSSSTLTNKEQTDGGELLTVTPAPTFDSGVEASVDAASASGLTDGLVAQTENFTALGLGGHTPSGLLQTLLEFLHVNAHLPWWASIVAATVGVRLLLFPLAVRMMRDSAKIANLNPTASKIHETMATYKRIGNHVAAAEEGAKLLEIYKRHGVNPVATMFMVPFIQLPVFMSFFWGIRGMTALPVESMKTGGLFWFMDLTVPDPAYVLPLVACLAFISNVEVICSTVESCIIIIIIVNFLGGFQFLWLIGQ